MFIHAHGFACYGLQYLKISFGVLKGCPLFLDLFQATLAYLFFYLNFVIWYVIIHTRVGVFTGIALIKTEV